MRSMGRRVGVPFSYSSEPLVAVVDKRDEREKEREKVGER